MHRVGAGARSAVIARQRLAVRVRCRSSHLLGARKKEFSRCRCTMYDRCTMSFLCTKPRHFRSKPWAQEQLQIASRCASRPKKEKAAGLLLWTSSSCKRRPLAFSCNLKILRLTSPLHRYSENNVYTNYFIPEVSLRSCSSAREPRGVPASSAGPTAEGTVDVPNVPLGVLCTR